MVRQDETSRPDRERCQEVMPAASSLHKYAGYVDRDIVPDLVGGAVDTVFPDRFVEVAVLSRRWLVRFPFVNTQRSRILFSARRWRSGLL
jgi:hypothetical protein